MISSIRIALGCFYQLIFYFSEILSLNLLFAVEETLTLNLSIVVFLTIVAFFSV